MNKNDALDLLRAIAPDLHGRLGDAFRMAVNALENQPDEEECEACKIHYEDDLK